MHDLVLLAIHAGRTLPALLKAEGAALGDVAGERPLEPTAGTDELTRRITASDELRGLAALLVERASAMAEPSPGHPGGVCDPVASGPAADSP